MDDDDSDPLVDVLNWAAVLAESFTQFYARYPRHTLREGVLLELNAEMAIHEAQLRRYGCEVVCLHAVVEAFAKWRDLARRIELAALPSGSEPKINRPNFTSKGVR